MRKWHLAARLTAFLVFVACFIHRAGQPPIADEVDFMKPIEAWVSDGPRVQGLWHAPFYPWFLSLLGKAFGFSQTVFRLIGLATTSVTTALMVMTARRLGFDEWKVTLVVVFGLLSPVALGSAMMLDYDNTLLVASTALFLYLLARFGDTSHEHVAKHAVVLGASIGLCLMSKETTPLIYPVGVAVLWGRRLGWMRSLGWAMFSGTTGLVFFLFVSQLWFWRYDLPIRTMFELDYACLLRRTGENIGAARALWIKTSPFIWLGLPMAILFIVRLPRLLTIKSGIAAIASVVAVTLFFYVFVLTQMTFHFPKYMAPVLPWIGLLLLAVESASLEGRRLAFWLAVTFIWFAVLPDPLRILYVRSSRELPMALIPYAVPFVAWFVAYRIKRKPGSCPSAALLAILLSLGLCVPYVRSTLFSGGSVTYWYGERGIAEAKEVISDWRAKFPNGVVYSPSKDIAYSTREYGTIYVGMDEMLGLGARLCAQNSPLLVVTRVREESSLLSAPQMAPYRGCLKIVTASDVAFGVAHEH